MRAGCKADDKAFVDAMAVAWSVTQPLVSDIQLQSAQASMGTPHGALGIDGGAPAPQLELPPREPDAELLVPPSVIVFGSAPVSLQYVGS